VRGLLQRVAEILKYSRFTRTAVACQTSEAVPSEDMTSCFVFLLAEATSQLNVIELESTARKAWLLLHASEVTG
jgi:hypothetical protein